MKKKIRTYIVAIVSAVFLLGSSSLSLAAVTKAAATPTPDANSSASKNASAQPPRGGSQLNLKPILDKLVKAKTITTAQETKVIAYQNKKIAAQKAEMAKLQKMTEAQRKVYLDKQRATRNSQSKKVSQFADLVKNKTITQKQADAIDKAIAANRPARGNGQAPAGGQWPSNGN